MRSTPLLTEAEPLEAYSVRLRFEDGTTGEVDLSYLLEYGGVFQPLRDPDYFGQLRADSEAGTIVWPNGGRYRAGDPVRPRAGVDSSHRVTSGWSGAPR
jgi:hypothetical protein